MQEAWVFLLFIAVFRAFRKPVCGHFLFHRLLSEALAAANRIEPAPFPVWGDRKTIYHLFGMPSRALTGLRAKGIVRTAKLGDAKQSATLYRLEDVDRALLAMATGNEPTRPRYQATRTAKRRE